MKLKKRTDDRQGNDLQSPDVIVKADPKSSADPRLWIEALVYPGCFVTFESFRLEGEVHFMNGTPFDTEKIALNDENGFLSRLRISDTARSTYYELKFLSQRTEIQESFRIQVTERPANGCAPRL
ncbi:MAG: hypothetical protein AAF725_26120, partial [Acidobacteriota bacterium]